MRLACLLLALLPNLVLAETLSGAPAIMEGDTLVIHNERIRLYGIDAPESAQHCYRLDGSRWPCGQSAASVLADAIGRQNVHCRGHGRDRRGRLLAVCFHQGQDLNARMVREGWALAARQDTLDYIDEEEQAKASRVGIWSGAFTVPWEWPARRRGESTSDDEDYPPFGHQGAAGRFGQF